MAAQSIETKKGGQLCCTSVINEENVQTIHDSSRSNLRYSKYCKKFKRKKSKVIKSRAGRG